MTTLLHLIEDPNKASATLSALAAVMILVAGFFQWWDITYDGELRTKLWVRLTVSLCIAFVIAAWSLVVLSSP
ncbi:MAG: hypothetical protein CL878_13675 [Dehalococcoidia bacterium]|nr:hypothetical protein [Dehalococcoidia bacterium]